MGDPNYVEMLARSWHAAIQVITYGHLKDFKPTDWELESGGCKSDLMSCFRQLIEDGLIPASMDWEWEAIFRKTLQSLSRLTPEEHERLLKAMGAKEVHTAYGTLRIIEHPPLSPKKEEGR